ncbi:signal peptidase I [Candidatus Falkowbacteria bacterium]|nr:signal peptidase I [Candidatus Falkowbacteria bacterium]
MIKDFFIFVFELVKIVVISLVIIIPIRYFLIQPFYVKGASMEPNFYDKEYLIIDEITYRFETPKRGDIVVFRYPQDPQEYFIKRVIALPGEKVQLKNGDVYVFNKDNPDGFKLDEAYLPAGLKTYALSEDPVTVTDNQFFVLGDNRNSSRDSRYFGPVNKSFFIGKVLFRGWPFDRVKVFKSQQYNYN